jgi:hypothetical protein
MDITGTAWDLAVTQHFTRSELEWSVFPTGYSDEPTLLHFILREGEFIPLPACRDGIDNDGDGFIDYPNDPGCESFSDNNEESVCFDSDGGQVFDVAGYVTLAGIRYDDYCYPTPDVVGVQEYYCNGEMVGSLGRGCEYVFGPNAVCENGACKPAPQCNNEIDDDNDGLTDMNDPDCTSLDDNSEAPNGEYFYSKNYGLVARLFDNGNVLLAGSCSKKTDCVEPAKSLLVMENPNGEVVSYVDYSGNICVESGDCARDESCSVGENDYVIMGETGVPKIVFKTDGSLCYTGILRESIPAQMNIPESAVGGGEETQASLSPSVEGWWDKVLKFFLKGGEE